MEGNKILPRNMICKVCGKQCYDDEVPEVVFSEGTTFICEMCSIDYEMIDGKIVRREL